MEDKGNIGTWFTLTRVVVRLNFPCSGVLVEQRLLLPKANIMSTHLLWTQQQ